MLDAIQEEFLQLCNPVLFEYLVTWSIIENTIVAILQQDY